MKKLHLILLCLYGFSLPFEYYNPWGISSIFSIAKIAGFSYALVSIFLFFPVKLTNYKVNKVVNPLVVLFIYITVLSTLNLSGAIYSSIINISWLLCIFSFFLISKDLAYHDKYIDYVMISFVISILLVSLLVNFGIGIQYNSTNTTKTIYSGRLYFMGTNPNSAAMWACFASVIVYYYLLYTKIGFLYKTLSIISLFLFVQFISMTASRGAFFAFFIISIIFLFASSKKNKTGRNIIILAIGMVLIGLMYNYMLGNEMLQRRLLRTYESGDTGSRTKIWKVAFEGFLNYPLGMGETGWEKYSQIHAGHYLSTHNLFFYFLVTGGILGILLFVTFLYKIFKPILKSRKTNYGILAFSLFFLVLFDFSKNGGAIDQKTDYFFLAIAFAISLKAHYIEIKNNNHSTIAMQKQPYN